MSEAPKEIWLDETSEDDYGLFICEAEKRHINMDTHYTRTDAISPQTAANVLMDAQNLDGMTLLPNYVRAMLRVIAGEDTTTPL